MIEKYGLSSNNTLFQRSQYRRGKELIISATFHQSIARELFNFLMMAKPYVKEGQEEQEEDNKRSKDVQLVDCIKEFKQSEVLDEDNMWYCNICKDFVQATKSLEIYRIPRNLVISLKRFKTSRSRYGFGGGGQKIDTLVEFPLEGLDLSPFVLSDTQRRKESLIYDCYAVSNHFGSVGFGHYTAYGKNPKDGQWYEFDDSSVSRVDGGMRRRDVVSSGAYNLFYRRRDNVNMENIDYDNII